MLLIGTKSYLTCTSFTHHTIPNDFSGAILVSNKIVFALQNTMSYQSTVDGIPENKTGGMNTSFTTSSRPLTRVTTWSHTRVPVHLPGSLYSILLSNFQKSDTYSIFHGRKTYPGINFSFIRIRHNRVSLFYPGHSPSISLHLDPSCILSQIPSSYLIISLHSSSTHVKSHSLWYSVDNTGPMAHSTTIVFLLTPPK